MIKAKEKVFQNVNTDIIESLKEALTGLTATEWAYIKGSIDMYFSKKAAEIKIDDLDMLDIYLKRGI